MKTATIVPVALVLCLASHRADRLTVSCDRARTNMASAFISMDDPAPGDTMLTAMVCMIPAAKMGVGSYHGELTYDTLAARLLTAQHPSDGIRLENTTAPGKIVFAGATTSGFVAGPLLSVRFRLRVAGRRPRLVLHLGELNDMAGKSLTALLRVDSLPGAAASSPDSCDRGIPHIRSISPTELDISSGDQTPLTIAGCAFAATNTLRVGPVTFSSVPSAENGTVVRFVVPLVLPASGEAPPRRMPVGNVDVTVTTTVASSNRMQVKLK